MLLENYDIHRERLDFLKDKAILESDDINPSLKMLDRELFKGSRFSDKKFDAEYADVCINYAIEQLTQTIDNLSMIVDELEDIRGEVYGLNNAERERMLSMP